MCRPFSWRRHVDVHKVEGVKLMWTEGGGQKSRFSCGRHKWMTPKRRAHMGGDLRVYWGDCSPKFVWGGGTAHGYVPPISHRSEGRSLSLL